MPEFIEAFKRLICSKKYEIGQASQFLFRHSHLLVRLQCGHSCHSLLPVLLLCRHSGLSVVLVRLLCGHSRHSLFLVKVTAAIQAYFLCYSRWMTDIHPNIHFWMSVCYASIHQNSKLLVIFAMYHSRHSPLLVWVLCGRGCGHSRLLVKFTCDHSPLNSNSEWSQSVLETQT